jgi:sulfhydrogenase subunit beta (sulfur reductase)
MDTVDKKGLLKFLEKVKKSHKLVAPLKKEEGLFFDTVNSVNDIVLDYINPKNTVKDFVFPIKEKMFSFDKLEQSVFDGSIAIFGVRPCDARALNVMDKVFNWDEKDEMYNARRSKLLLIGFACNKAGPHCFCTSFGYGPHDDSGMDIMVYEVDGKFSLVGVSAKGKKLVIGKKPSVVEPVIEKKMDVEKVYLKLDSMFDSDYWKEVTFNCIGCGTCTYLCPSCHCFGMSDEKGSRYRVWDSCQFGSFTKHTSGHNPRPTQAERYRQRVYHKFNYYKKNFGVHLCVGCGRCTQHCPMNVDIFTIAKGVLDR